MSENVVDLNVTPLYNKHLEAGARMVPFSGWNMPVQYTGIIEEHLHTRSRAGLFDICHMGEFFLRGSSAGEEVDRLVTCRIDDMPAGKCRYGFLLREDGGIIDDLIVFKISPEEFMLVVNSGTVEKDRKWIESHVSSGTEFSDESDRMAKLDLQGPLSAEVLSRILGRSTVESVRRYYFAGVVMEGVKVLLSRTGYTGEQGYELFFPAERAAMLWDMLSAYKEVKPVGLGARDTLRMEMGYSLYGNDIDEDRTPFEANLSKFVFMEKDFIGKEELLKRKEKGINRILTGFICEGRRSARSHFTVMCDDRAIGEVTSGAFSPCLKKGIGLCYIDKECFIEGQGILLSDGKAGIRAAVKKIPIYER
ncbi:MAG: glycine cleavage system aminomethyltransferase GcvT [Candidatus Omnitrophota bacterium]|nr:glycine cleavage system aminomethyltransferase GcvT [Candidatus Omnitrophota bacterium]